MTSALLTNQSRLQKIRDKLSENEMDALFVSTPQNRRYLSGFTGTAGYLVITATTAILATDFRYVEQATNQAPGYDIFRMTGGDWFPRLLSDLTVRNVGFESHNLTVAQYKHYTDLLKTKNHETHTSLVATAGLVENLRSRKDSEELSSIQMAIDIADRAFNEISNKLRPGMTERQIAWDLEMLIREQGAESVSFDLIVAAGPNGAMPHHRPSDRAVKNGEPIVIDMGARYSGYCSDMSRTIILGQPDDRFRKIYDTVLAAQETAIATVQTGITGENADSLARNIIVEAGYGNNFGHGTGHGVGLDVHEHPSVGPGSSSTLEDGMVFTIEPGIYLTNWGGVRIEDMLVFENGKARVITHANKRDSAA